MENLEEVLIEQLKDLYSAETQLADALPIMMEGASHKKLKSALSSHLEETKTQIERLEKIAKALGEDLTGHTCKGMKGLIKEGEDALNEDYEDTVLKDIQIVAAAQRVEHYEIAGYGNAIALADFLEMKEVSFLLGETIVEEGNADKALTKLTKDQLFTAFQ
jgi:ferritin-like metal-binding protein YciE